MADSLNKFYSSADQILSNYENYKDYFTTNSNDSLGQDEFLQLMVEQMKNQDYLNPTDNTEFIAQMAQFSSVNQLTEVNYYTNATYATSLVGKTVVAATYDYSGNVIKETGVVSAVKLNGKTFELIVNGKSFTTSNIMEVLASGTQETTDEETENNDENSESGSGTDDGANYNEDGSPNYSQDLF